MRNILTILIVVYLSSCNPTEESSPTTRKIFSLQVDANYSDVENWFIIHDLDGNIIDYGEFKNGDKLDIETDKALRENKMNLTFLRSYDFTSSISFNLQSFLSIESGATWTLKSPALPPTTPPQSGVATIEISNVFDFYMYAFSNKLGKSGDAEAWSGGIGLLKFYPQLYIGASDYLVSIDQGFGNPKYKFFENLSDKTVIKLSSNDLQEFDSYVEVSFQPTKDIFVYVQGYEPDRPTFFTGYRMYEGIFPHTVDKSSLKIGYLNRFDRYLSTVTVNYTNKGYFYTKSGAKPTSINFPFNLTVNLNNKSFSDFSYTTSGDFKFRSTTFDFKDLVSTPKVFVTWNVIGEPGNQIKGDLPPELKAKFPQIQTNKLIHLSSSFFTNGQSYKDYINFILNRTSEDEAFEQTGITVR